MTPVDPDHSRLNIRQFILPFEGDRHLHRTHQMLLASAIAAILMVFAAGTMLAMMF